MATLDTIPAMSLPPTFLPVLSLTILTATPDTILATTPGTATLLYLVLATATTSAARSLVARAVRTPGVGPCAGPSVTSSRPVWGAAGTTRARTARTPSCAVSLEAEGTATTLASTPGRDREATE